MSLSKYTYITRDNPGVLHNMNNYMRLELLLATITAAMSARYLTVSDLRALLFIAKAHKEGEPMTQGYLQQVLGMKPKVATSTLKFYEDRGLIIRCSDPADRRAKLLQLTDKGNAVVHHIDEMLGSYRTS